MEIERCKYGILGIREVNYWKHFNQAVKYLKSFGLFWNEEENRYTYK